MLTIFFLAHKLDSVNYTKHLKNTHFRRSMWGGEHSYLSVKVQSIISNTFSNNCTGHFIPYKCKSANRFFLTSVDLQLTHKYKCTIAKPWNFTQDSPECLSNKITDHTPIINIHSGTICVKDSSNSYLCKTEITKIRLQQIQCSNYA